MNTSATVSANMSTEQSLTADFESPASVNEPPSSSTKQVVAHSSVGPTEGGTVNAAIFRSVVKLFVVKCAPNHSRPWQMSSQSHSSSSGFVISGRRILCNAHGVTYARSIRVRKHGDSKKYDAKLQHIGHECDLAILTVDNARFWRNLEPLTFDSKTPKLQDIVVVVGYPIGGDNICVTKGVVSRVGFVSYSHALENLFSLQIDAAINPGNSGGPTIMNQRVVGVAFETHLNSQNIGYCIPVRVVQHFLDDIAQHGGYTSFPKLGCRWQKIENPSLKKYLQMVSDDDHSPRSDAVDGDGDGDDEHKSDGHALNGVLLNMMYPLTDCHSKLKQNDVLLEIDGVAIGEDGTIQYPYPEDGVSRINYSYITSNKFCGDEVALRILRDGHILSVNVTLDIIDYLVPIVLYDRPVTYYIFGGFVFVPLSRPYLRAEYGSKWSSKCAVRLKDLYFNGYKEADDEEVVLLSRVLASDLNVGFHKFTNCVLEKANGVEIKSMRRLVEVIEGGSGSGDGGDEGDSKFVRFTFEHNVTMVLERDIAVEGMPSIMEEHKIKFDRSENLRGLSKNEEPMDTDTDSAAASKTGDGAVGAL